MTVQGIKEVEIDALPFAAPLRAIDHISIQNSASKLTLRATKMIDAKDPYMSGHFPDFIIFPGIFIIEGLRQAVALTLSMLEGVLPEIITLRSVRFTAPLLPGDRMTLDATIGPMSEKKSFEVEARCERSDGVMAAHLKIEFQYRGTVDA